MRIGSKTPARNHVRVAFLPTYITVNTARIPTGASAPECGQTRGRGRGRGVRIDGDIYQRVLGEELRKLRRRRGWTRKELNQHLQSDISLQTLATYELGTRQVSVMRLVELCEALEELPQDLLARVHRRMFPNEPGWVRLDLYQLAADTQPELLPLRRWAEGRLSHSNSAREVQLDEAAIKQLAALCGLRPAELIGRLDSLASSPRR